MSAHHVFLSADTGTARDWADAARDMAQELGEFVPGPAFKAQVDYLAWLGNHREQEGYAAGVEDVLRYLTGDAPATPQLQGILDRAEVTA